MTRDEEIENKASELAQKYFHNEHNIWARENLKAQFVSSACIEMAKWADETMIEKACEWLEENIDTYSKVIIVENSIPTIVLTKDFKNAFTKAIK